MTPDEKLELAELMKITAVGSGKRLTKDQKVRLRLLVGRDAVSRLGRFINSIKEESSK